VAPPAASGDTPTITFPPEVEAAISAVLPSTDPLDQPGLDTTLYINNIFPTEQSLAGLEDYMSCVSVQVSDLEDEMREMVRSQTQVGGDAAAALQHAQGSILQLFGQIRDIKNKAGQSEAMVKEITRDIKQLDTAKRNLTTAITTLNHLHMLVRGTASLSQLAQARQYGEAALLLQGLIEVLNHFHAYQDIPQIRELADQVGSLKRELGEQIIKDFEAALGGENPGAAGSSKQLAEACLVVDVLEPQVKRSLMSWFVGLQLKEYQIMFSPGEDDAWLDKVDRRYNWLKKHLIEFEERFGPLFPPAWEMSERIAAEFCRVTKGELSKLLAARIKEVDTKLLLHSIQKTVAFESLLSRRFSGVTLASSHQLEVSTNPFENETPDIASSVSVENYQNINLTPFKGVISQCFEPYLYIYIEAQDKALSEMVARFSSSLETEGVSGCSSPEGSPVLPSCGDLFVFYRKCLVQCSELSTGQPLLALATLFKKYLREYTLQVLVASLPKVSSGPGSSLPNLKDMKDISQISALATSGIFANFSSLLKEGGSGEGVLRLSPPEQELICTCLVTVEYCIDTASQLEAKLKQKVEGEPEQVSFSGELSLLHSVTNNCVSLLVQELEAACQQPLNNMAKVSWSTIEQVGDQSAYVSQLTGAMRGIVPRVRHCLSTSRKYFTQFCLKFSTSFIGKFLSQVYKCKPMGTVGAEQLLLDTHSLKTVLLSLPTMESEQHSLAHLGQQGVQGRKAPQAYTKVVVKGMTRAEMLLKVVMSPAEPKENFVDQYRRLVGEPDSSELAKLLDMKGVRRGEQGAFMDIFRDSKPETESVGGVGVKEEGELADEEQVSPSRIKKLEKLIKEKI